MFIRTAGQLIYIARSVGSWHYFVRFRELRVDRAKHAKHEIVFYAFDVLSLNGRELTADPLTKRREQPQKIIATDPAVRVSQFDIVVALSSRFMR